MRRSSRKNDQLSTIEDVARLSGVSTATVSRFLNHPNIVAKPTAQKVRAAIAELKYVPNAIAGSLASSKSQLIAILVPNLTSSIVEETIEALVNRLTASGTVPFLGITGMDPVRTNDVLMAALSRRVTAVITTGLIPEPARGMLLQSNTSVIEMWGLPPEPVDIAIGFSHLDVGRALAKFSYERGYRRPHLVTARGTRAQLRRDGFLEDWLKLGGAMPTEQEIAIPSTYDEGRRILDAISDLPTRPDLVVTGSDFVAHGLIAHAQRRGLRVPEDLAVMGFGDVGIAAMIEPSITTVRIDGAKIADRAIEVIRTRDEDKEPESRRIDCGFEIMERESA